MPHEGRTTALSDRGQLITQVLTLHQRAHPSISSPCACGYEYPLGTRTILHQADAIDAALIMLELGTPQHDVSRMIETAQHHADTRRRTDPWHP